MGEHCGMWANRVVEERGAYGIRVLQGLVAMSRKRSSAKIDEACRKALAGDQMHLRQIRGLIDTCEEQAELQFLSEHPLIRKMEEYGRITAQTQEAEHDEERTR